MFHSRRLWMTLTVLLLLLVALSACAGYPQVKPPEPTNTPLPPAPTEPPATATVPIPTVTAIPPTATTVPPTETPASAPATGNGSAQGDVQAGAQVYASTCAACHGQKGEGAIGPKLQNLSLSPDEIATIIKGGKQGTAMPAFGSQLSDQDIQNLVAFLKSLVPK